MHGMEVANMITEDYIQRFEAFCDNYIHGLDSMPSDEAKKKARENLIAIGVLDKDGREKKQIVTGDFFGW